MALMPRKKRSALMADINVTPLVDVMLVLLIIFMVTAPMMTQGVNVDLPETTSKPLPQKEKPFVVSLNKKGDLYIGRLKANRDLLRQELTALGKSGKDKPIFLKADKNVPYGFVVAVMADIKDAGFDKLGMVTEPSGKRSSRK